MITQLDILPWEPPACTIIAFPAAKRVGRIRDVASKLAGKSQGAADHYCRQVTEGIFTHLTRLGFTEAEQDEFVGAFWAAVEAEIQRRAYRPTGGAA